MNIFLSNFSWMMPNLALASLGFVFALMYLRTKSKLWKLLLFIAWFLFVPNTIYLLTDVQHYFEQLTRVDLLGWVLITIQYIALVAFGVLTYFAGMMPMEEFFKRVKFKHYSFVFLIFNFAIAFAVVLGKIERTHSWYVVTQPLRVINDIEHLLKTPVLVIAVILLGILFNLIYFTFRKKISKLFKKH